MRSFAAMLLLSGLMPLLAPEHAAAQGGPNVTLQLPSFHATGVNTTVLVPDSGTSAIARDRQAYTHRTSYGPLRQRALGQSLGSQSLQVDAQVHDPAAAEAEVLRNARSRRANWQRGSVLAREPLNTEADSAPPLVSIAEIKQRQARAKLAQQQESQSLLGEARRAAREGKPGVAAIYYGMAARQADANLRTAIEAEASRVADAARVARATSDKPAP